MRRWAKIVPVAFATTLCLSVVACTPTTTDGRGSGGLFTPSTGGSGTTNGSSTSAAVPPTPGAIPGIIHKDEPARTHVASGTVRYDTAPPIGGDHSPYWADCTGTAYPDAIANENAVHMLEHGAVWITYRQGLPADQIAPLSALVMGRDYTALSPYPGLRTNVSLQSWGYQLFVDSPTDPRIAQFVAVLRQNRQTTPEPGATCSQPAFKLNPSRFGVPKFGP